MIKSFNLKWAHAINSKDQLRNVLSIGNVDFIEADVRFFPNNNTAIMCHPPKLNSDLTFLEFIDTIYNNNSNQTIGIKLDFKDPPAVELCISYLISKIESHQSSSSSSSSREIWLNADILEGPGAKQSSFDANTFIKQCIPLIQRFPKSKIRFSLGWTTILPTPENPSSTQYTESMIKQMLSICDSYKLENVTFPMRSSLIRNSIPAIRMLLQHNPSFSLTLWNSKFDSELISQSDLDNFFLKQPSEFSPYGINPQLYIDLYRRCEDEGEISKHRFEILKQGPFATIFSTLLPGKRKYSDEIQNLIDSNWEKLLQDKSKLLFDGPVFSMFDSQVKPWTENNNNNNTNNNNNNNNHSSSSSTTTTFHQANSFNFPFSPSFILETTVQESSYKAAMTTNNLNYIAKYGANAERTNNLGVCSVTLTLDGKIIIGERSTRVAEGASLWHVVPAGTLDDVSPMETISKELSEELGLSWKDDVEYLYCMALGAVKSTHKPEYLMHMKLKLTSSQVSEKLKSAVDKDEHKTIEFVPIDQLKQFIDTHNLTNIGRAALSVFLHLQKQ